LEVRGDGFRIFTRRLGTRPLCARQAEIPQSIRQGEGHPSAATLLAQAFGQGLKPRIGQKVRRAWGRNAPDFLNGSD
jgi:hypothetical protein